MVSSLLCSLVLVGEPTEVPPDPASATVGQGRDEVVAPGPPDQARIADINRVWRGVGLGYANGLFGQGYAQSLRADVPFGRRIGQFLGLRVEGRFVTPPPGTGDPYDPLVTTGLMVFGRGPVWLGLFRAYGGGGAWLGIRPNPAVTGEDFALGGGGFFGGEVLISRRVSFTFEVGGQAPAHVGSDFDAGASVMGGMMVHLGALGSRPAG